jgi:hypothetical protein
MMALQLASDMSLHGHSLRADSQPGIYTAA